MKNIISTIAQNRWYISERVLGYSEEELDKIEKLYDIRISGHLRDFMLEAGRSDGGLIGDDPLIIFRNLWSVRNQVLTQTSIRDSILDLSLYSDPPSDGIFYNKPFIFSIEYETQYYYLNTGAENSSRVFHYDENNELIEDTQMDFIEYMKYLVRTYGKFEPRIICRGELLVII